MDLSRCDPIVNRGAAVMEMQMVYKRVESAQPLLESEKMQI
jgi:hypothetical protein